MSKEQDDRDREVDIVMQIAELAAELGWVIALPDMDNTTDGLIMGTTGWIKENGPNIYGPEFVIFEQDPMTGELTDSAAGDGGNKLH